MVSTVKKGVKCQQVMEALERIAPKRLAEEWDNPGLLVGSPAQEVHKILTCLDVTDEVVAEAIDLGADMIVAHHPLIFKGIKKLRTDLPLGGRLQQLLVHGIAVAAAHTNLDSAEGGVNDVLAKAIGLTDIQPFEGKAEEGAEPTLGRIGYLAEPMAIEDFARRVRAALPVSHVRMVKAGDKPVRKVALCSGAGAEFISKASFLGADAYVTGDVKYHEAQQAVEMGIHVIDGGHFGTEFPIAAVLADRLREELSGLKGEAEVVTDTLSQDVFAIV